MQCWWASRAVRYRSLLRPDLPEGHGPQEKPANRCETRAQAYSGQERRPAKISANRCSTSIRGDSRALGKNKGPTTSRFSG
jgi:hypothetical protein